MQKLLFILFFAVVGFLTVNAQSKTVVSGSVSDEKGELLIGVSIRQKGAIVGTISDLDGKFSLTVDAKASIVVSYVGYATQELKVSGEKQSLFIVLKEDLQLLDEVVVVGFGTQKRRDIVGAISSVSAKDLAATGQTNVLQALQGSVPGLRIDNPASPAGEPDVRIRGLNTLTSTNASPLYIVDGVPFYDMRAIDPNDIQSIEVLKDASAAAIYGSQAANGVLLITTKRGSGGKPTVSASFSYSLQNPITEPDLMDGKNYLAFKAEALRYKTPSDWDAVKDDPDALARRVLTNSEYNQWAAEIEIDPYEMMLHRNAPITETSVSIGGGEKAKYYIGANYLDNQGLVQSTFFNRFSIRANIDLDVNEYIRISNYANIFKYKSRDLTGGNNGLSAMYRLSPYSIMNEENGEYKLFPMPDDALYGNPLSDAYDVEKSKSRFGVNNLSILHVNIPWIKGLSAEGKYQFEIRQQKDGSLAFTNTPQGATGAVAERQYQDWNKWYAEGLLAYNRDFGKHNVDITAMSSAEYRDYESSDLLATGIPLSAYLWYQPETATNPLQTTTGYNSRTLVGLMFRANYNYAGKYYATFTVRRDGFSSFSVKSKWATFPSAALAWRINEES
ncbi:MAG: SusC/RagA family TonB-linked outer membrane protein, partial [Candidatus Symbiothrix sp.]|nr:SusC/RagA family TonB-linked outer membrane protein [Candidatus Symbiothrix sp.]